jgi:hypothetical protein
VADVIKTIPRPSLPTKPVRFPAYGFLLISVLMAISFVGSLTELAGGHPLVSPIPFPRLLITC